MIIKLGITSIGKLTNNLVIIIKYIVELRETMEFIENIDRDTYELFVENNPYKSHYLQSYAWGEFAQKSKNFTPHYVGIKNEQGLIAATLLLEKKLPFNYCYYYIPRGFVMDMSNTDMLKQFVSYLKQYGKKKKAIFIKLDSDIILNEEDCNGIKKDLPYNGFQILENLKKLGFHHRGFTKNFELNQPRYSFRIDFTKSLQDIKNNFSKTTKQRIKKAEEYEIEVKIGSEKDIPTFFELMRITEERKEFMTHGIEYYQNLYRIWKKNNDCAIFFGIVNLKKIVEKLEQKEKNIKQELQPLLMIESCSKTQNNKKREFEKQLEKINSDIKKYKQYQIEYGDRMTLSAHFIIQYGDKAWVLYAGNHNILSETYANYKTYETHIEHYYHKKIKIYDQFGTIGDLREENPLYGLHEFKKKFGGDYVEFIGEFDLILNHILYFLFQKLVPFYRKRKFRKMKKNFDAEKI